MAKNTNPFGMTDDDLSKVVQNIVADAICQP